MSASSLHATDTDRVLVHSLFLQYVLNRLSQLQVAVLTLDFSQGHPGDLTCETSNLTLR